MHKEKDLKKKHFPLHYYVLSPKITTAMSDFMHCVVDIGMEDIAMTGLGFTWNKRPGKPGVY